MIKNKDMKKIYTMAAGFLLCVGLVSCEMKEEIFGNDVIPSETGLVELGVAVDDKTNVVITKAEATEGEDEMGSSVDPSDFPVIFTLKTNENYKKEFTYSKIAGKTVELPIGTYEVVSHTPGEMEREMSAPYYKGNGELTVEKDLTEQAEVFCKMQNSRILMVYPENFKTEFSEWTIIIDDGTDNTLKFVYDKDNQNLNPAAVYWAISENCPTLTISIKAITKTGAAVSDSRTITKPDGAADKNWVGGDALTITMEPIEDNTGDVSGISIKVDSFFETVKGDIIEAPLGDEDTETPTDPDGGEEDGDTTDGPTITMPDNGLIEYTLKGNDAPETAVVTVSAPAKFQSLTVKIKGGNSGFKDAVGSMGFDEGIDIMKLDKNSNDPIIQIVIKVLGDIPTTDSTEPYSLDIANFFDMMDPYGDTGSDAHEFEITVWDQNGKNATGTLKVKINPATTEGE